MPRSRSRSRRGRRPRCRGRSRSRRRRRSRSRSHVGAHEVSRRGQREVGRNDKVPRVGPATADAPSFTAAPPASAAVGRKSEANGDSMPPVDPTDVLVPMPSANVDSGAGSDPLCVWESPRPIGKVLPIYNEDGWLKPGAQPPPPPPGPPPTSALPAQPTTSTRAAGNSALTGAALARSGQLPTGVTGAALVRLGQLPPDSQMDSLRNKKNPVCIKFLAGSCANPLGCSQRHPEDPQEIVHWLTYFKQRPCKAGAGCIWRPNCVYGHPEDGDVVAAEK